MLKALPLRALHRTPLKRGKITPAAKPTIFGTGCTGHLHGDVEGGRSVEDEENIGAIRIAAILLFVCRISEKANDR